MVVHWAGEKSNVIVALARDSLALARPRSSDVSIGTSLSASVLPRALCGPPGGSLEHGRGGFPHREQNLGNSKCCLLAEHRVV